MPGWELLSPPFTAPPGDALLGLPHRRTLGTLPCLSALVCPLPGSETSIRASGCTRAQQEGVWTCTVAWCRACGRVPGLSAGVEAMSPSPTEAALGHGSDRLLPSPLQACGALTLAGCRVPAHTLPRCPPQQDRGRKYGETLVAERRPGRRRDACCHGQKRLGSVKSDGICGHVRTAQ